MRVMVALYCGSYDKPPASVTLDIDDTLDVVHGHQQLSMFNALWTSAAQATRKLGAIESAADSPIRTNQDRAVVTD